MAAFVVATAAAQLPALAGTAAQAAPSTGLVDGQIIQVTGSGFDPGRTIQVMECSGTLTAPPKDIKVCQGLTLDTSSYTDLQGGFIDGASDPSGLTQGFKVYMLPGPSLPAGPTKCDPADPCLLFVGEDHNDFSKPHVFVPISFAAAASRAGSGTTVAGTSTRSGTPGMGQAATAGASLPRTGSSRGALVALSVGAIALVAGGGYLFLRRRRFAQRSGM